MTDNSGITDRFRVYVEVRQKHGLWCASGTTRVHDDGWVCAAALFVVIPLVKVGIGDEIFPKYYAAIVCWKTNFFDMKCSIELFLKEAEAIRWTNYDDTLKLSGVTETINLIKYGVNYEYVFGICYLDIVFELFLR